MGSLNRLDHTPLVPAIVSDEREHLRLLTAAVNNLITSQPVPGRWEDNLSSLSAGKAVGANAPTWATVRDGLSAYSFDASTMNEIWISYHVTHDYKPGTKMYPHIHWTQIAASPSGTVRWGIEYSYAKGHDQAAFPASTTIYLEQTCTAQYQHMILETPDDDAIPADNLEVDGVIMMRVFRDAAHANDTSTDAAFGFFVDIHYEKDRFGTINKAPNFYE